jgi:hypothetical protein
MSRCEQTNNEAGAARSLLARESEKGSELRE